MQLVLGQAPPQGVDGYYFVVGALLAAKLFLARYLVFGEALGLGAVADVLVVVALMGLSSVLGGRAGRRVAAVLSAIVSLVTLSTVLYASYYGQIPGFGVLRSFGQAATLGEDVSGLLGWQHALFVLDLPFVLFAGFARPADARQTRRLRSAAIGTLAACALFVFAFAARANGTATDSLRTSYIHGIAAFQLSSLAAAPQAVEEVVAEPSEAEALQARIDEITRHRAGRRKADAPEPGAASGLNLIVVQAEALQDCLIGARIDGQPVMPELERLAAESIYFPNTYSQTGRGNTSDAEFIANTGLYPGAPEAASISYARKEIPSLPRAFRAAGYESYTFHTNDAKFWNRFQMYPALGFDRYYDKQFFGTEDITRYGPSDHVLFDKSVDELLDKALSKKRFYAHVVTLSAHHPFTAVAGRGTLRLPANVENSATGRYLQSQSYFDHELGYLMRRLRATGLSRNTVVVIYGDHFGMNFNGETPLDKQVRAGLTDHGYNRADFQNIPLIIHMPENPMPRKYDDVVGQIDIMATIADLFGLDISQMPNFGRSAFVNTPSVMTRGADPGIYIDQDLFFVAGVKPSDDRLYDATTQAKLGTGERGDRLDVTTSLLELSHAYASGLPERPDASDEVGLIPTKKKESPSSGSK